MFHIFGNCKGLNKFDAPNEDVDIKFLFICMYVGIINCR